jgi:hypothetical protein
MCNVRISLLVVAMSGALLGAGSVTAQSFCDLVPAAAVKSALGITANLAAKPNMQGGNGCDYAAGGDGPAAVVADASDYTSVIKAVADARFAGPLLVGEELASGVGEVARYTRKVADIRAVRYIQQGLFFRAKGKYVNFTVTTLGSSGLPKAAILALGTYIVAQPINTLKDPSH